MNNEGSRGHSITAQERDAIIKALGYNPNSDKILAVAAQFGRGPSTILKLKRAGGL